MFVAFRRTKSMVEEGIGSGTVGATPIRIVKAGILFLEHRVIVETAVK